MERVMKKDLLPPVLEILKGKYGSLTPLSGQGILRGERVEFAFNGKPVRAVIKTSTGGRISFGRKDGKWSGLDDSDFVVIVAPTGLDQSDHMVSMFDKQTMAEIFDKNQAAQQAAGMGHLPNWVAPFHEHGRGPRGVGDGFGSKALWTEPLAPRTTIVEGGATRTPEPKTVRALTVEEAKLGIAKKYNVSPESIEIVIRW
jgi:hypothetical protein